MQAAYVTTVYVGGTYPVSTHGYFDVLKTNLMMLYVTHVIAR